MCCTQVSTSLKVIQPDCAEELQEKQQELRTRFVEACERSSDVRMPANEDLNYWWPLTSKPQS